MSIQEENKALKEENAILKRHLDSARRIALNATEDYLELRDIYLGIEPYIDDINSGDSLLVVIRAKDQEKIQSFINTLI